MGWGDEFQCGFPDVVWAGPIRFNTMWTTGHAEAGTERALLVNLGVTVKDNAVLCI